MNDQRWFIRSVGVVVFSFLALSRGTASAPEEFILENPDSGLNVTMGAPMAIDGNTMIVAGEGEYGQSRAQIYVYDSLEGWTLQAQLTTSLSHSATRVGISGDTAVISSSGDSALVFRRTGTSWAQEDTLEPPVPYESFGNAVAVCGDRIVVAATHTGYVFERNGADWTLEAEFSLGEDVFLGSLALTDERIIVAGWYSEIYIFVRNGADWLLEDTVVQLDPLDSFPGPIAISGDTIVAGSLCWSGFNYEGEYFTTGTGAAYVFTRNGSDWTKQAKLTTPTASIEEYFGYSVAIFGDRIVVGASQDNDDSGSAYVFTRSGEVWSEETKLTAEESLGFGSSVGISGDVICAGEGGAVHSFAHNGSAWSQQQKIVSLVTAAEEDRFGDAVAISGDTAVVGLPYDDYGSCRDSGSAIFYVREGEQWFEQARVRSSDARSRDEFGKDVSISGDTAVIGTWMMSSGDPGGAYIFQRTGSSWTQQAKLMPDYLTGNESIRGDVCISGETVAVEAWLSEDSGWRPAYVYVFRRSGENWLQEAKLPASDGGYAVSLSGDTLLVGADYDDENGHAAGAVYIYTRTGSAWSLQAKLLGSSQNLLFGNSVAMSGDIAVIGATWDAAGGEYSGAAYIYKRTNSTWLLVTKLKAPTVRARTYFGGAVSVSGDFVVVGGSGEEACVFRNNATKWQCLTRLTASDAAGLNYFGSEVAVDGGSVIVGAPLKDAPESNSGAAYIYEVGDLTSVRVPWGRYH